MHNVRPTTSVGIFPAWSLFIRFPFNFKDTFQMQSFIIHLPSELLSIIFAQLSQEDLINLPVCVISKGLSDQEILSNFSTINVWLDEKSLIALKRAAQHPLFSHHIQRLCFHTDELARIGPRNFHKGGCYPGEEYSESDETEQHLKVESSDCTEFIQEPEEGVKKYLRYKTLYHAQTVLKEQKKDYVLLIKALRRFRSQPSIFIDHHFGSSSQTRFPLLLGDAWVQKCERSYHRRAGSHLHDILVRSLARCKLSLSEFGFENTISPGNKTPQRLQYLPKTIHIGLPDHSDRRNETARLPQTFRHLRKFSIRSNGDSLKAYRRRCPGQTWGSRRKVISRYHLDPTLKFIIPQFERLEELELSFISEAISGGWLENMPQLPLLGLLNHRDASRRPPLRRLTFSNFRIRGDELVKFLLRYSGTLRTIHFTNLLITQGSRATVLEVLRNEMNLTSAIFDGFHLSSLSRFDKDYNRYTSKVPVVLALA